MFNRFTLYFLSCFDIIYKQIPSLIDEQYIHKVGGVLHIHKYLKWLAIASSVGMLLILLGGALVTKTDSGMGCGRHWPGCNGQLIPDEITAEVLIEFSHRLVTGAVGILILALAIWAWRALGHVRETKFLAFMAVFF